MSELNKYIALIESARAVIRLAETCKKENLMLSPRAFCIEDLKKDLIELDELPRLLH